MRLHLRPGFKLKTLLLLLSVLISQRAQGAIQGFWVWHPHPGPVRYLIPKIPGLTPSEFTHRYLKALKKSAAYGKMENTRHLNLSTAPDTFSPLPLSTSDHPNVAVLLNRPAQMMKTNTYLPTVIRSFEKEGPHLFSIPIGLETVLNPTEMKQWRTRLRSMDGQLGVGGDDVHPHAYGHTDISLTEGDISLKRDQEVLAYMKDYLEHGKGRVFYICGSMQRAAVLDGHTLHPDISHLSPIPHRGEDAPILLEITVEPDSELARAAGTTRFKTSNFHHSSVHEENPRDLDAPPKTRVVAYDVLPDGSRGKVVKAFEFPGNVGLGTQFHPEFRGSEEEHRIVRFVAMGWKMRGRHPASAIIRCLERDLLK